MILRKRPIENTIDVVEFVERVKEAVTQENAAEAIRDAVRLLLANYHIQQPDKKQPDKE
ncbi:MAG TPA: hypothetical protein VEC37_11850 [Bacillota bacterium]|nr:hypothetical protein [Bacillota bacterium]